MLLETQRPQALNKGYGGDVVESSPSEGLPPCHAAQLKPYKPEDKALERSAILASFGLTDRDLDFMGPMQRAMVDDAVERVRCAHSVA